MDYEKLWKDLKETLGDETLGRGEMRVKEYTFEVNPQSSKRILEMMERAEVFSR